MHTDLICWQLSDELRRLIIEQTADRTAAARDERFRSNLRDAIASACRNPYFNTARASLGETKDGITDGTERQYFGAEVAARMRALCRRATVANLRFLKSLNRPDP
ncbi:MAG: hypothetical protein DMF85_12690 [Acidobacteria bacterium]|nr:MAG: hypothetical protein DMF85_12690 [Acidobacteriota bacterium]